MKEGKYEGRMKKGQVPVREKRMICRTDVEVREKRRIYRTGLG